MIASILDYLKSDNELIGLLNHKKEHPKITAFEPHDKNSYPYLYIKLTPFNLGVVTDQYTLEVRIVTDDKLLIEYLTKKITDLLHFRNKAGIELNNQVIYHSSYSGSGFYFDEEKKVFEQVLFFATTFKYKKGLSKIE